MSVSYYAHMMLGILVPASAFLRVNTHRGCAHPVEEGSKAKFCAECGQPIWVEEEGKIEFSSPSRQFEAKVPNTADFDRCIDDERAPRIVGKRLPDACDVATLNVETLGALLRQELVLAGLPSDGPIRLYQYRYVSC